MKAFTLLVAALVPLGVMGASVLAENDRDLQELPVKTMEGWTWTDCGDPSDPIQLKSIEVSPDPPKPGEDMTVKVKGHVTGGIEEGAYADVLVKIGVVKLLQKRFDVCEEARNAEASVQCPVDEGDYVVEQTVALPKEIPRAKFVVQIRGFTVEDENLACVDLSVDFRPKFPHIW
ncbi:ML domain-containing protein [Phellopilus nigrolimitatus]|nr:ML domain-containing protein [Phellopilus nigrolimitatus]